MRATSAFVFVWLALCFLDLCQGAPRSKRTKTRGKDREHCQLTSDPGSCTSKYRRWFYDSTTDDCKTFFWTGCDGNDNRFRSRGQCERSCKDVTSIGGQTEGEENVVKVKPKSVAKCRRLPCKGLRCSHGYDHGLDDNGCQTCQCRSLPMTTTTAEPPVDACPQVVCPGKFCPRGFRLDDRGCMTCQCQGCPSLDCPPRLNCRDGYVVDKQTGCERCECSGAHASERPLPGSEGALPVAEKAFPVVRKPLPASKKTVLVEEKAVPTSKEVLSASKKALPVSGKAFSVDRDPLGASEKSLPVSAEANRCPDLKMACGPECELTTDETGCQICSCKNDHDVTGCDVTALAACSLYCPGGYDRDSRGCEICECRPLADERSPGEFVTCAPLEEEVCIERCELFIMKIDENGCETCECVVHQPHLTTPVPEVDERLAETENAGPTMKEEREEECPAIWCAHPCRLVEDGKCHRCLCDEPPEVDAPPTAVTCPEIQCAMWCPGGFRVDTETGCQLCACVEEGQTGSSIVVTADPWAVPDSKSVSEEEVESEEISPTPYSTLIDPTTLAAPVTDPADLEVSSTTATGYPAEMMCSGRKCDKKCVSGLRRSEDEECFLCDCNREPRHSKRLVDVSVFSARKGICSLPAYKGPCRATLTRWYFNFQTEACETFEYGGCRGYANNFRSEESCVEFCTSEVDQERTRRQEWFKEVNGF